MHQQYPCSHPHSRLQVPIHRGDSTAFEVFRSSLLDLQPQDAPRRTPGSLLDFLRHQPPVKAAPAREKRVGPFRRALLRLKAATGVTPQHLALAAQMLVAFELIVVRLLLLLVHTPPACKCGRPPPRWRPGFWPGRLQGGWKLSANCPALAPLFAGAGDNSRSQLSAGQPAVLGRLHCGGFLCMYVWQPRPHYLLQHPQGHIDPPETDCCSVCLRCLPRRPLQVAVLEPSAGVMAC